MHQHDHHHHAHGAAASNRRRLALTLALAAGYMVAEVVGGLMANSLALLADAGHMLSDVAALGLSLFANWIAARRSPPHHTFGYYRAEILAALVNGATLVAISILIFVEAYRRLQNPPEVHGVTMLLVASGGLLVNLAGLWILHGGRKDSLNVRGAWLHVLTDALGSVGVIVASLLVWAFGWYWSDPAASIVIGLLVIYSSWRLLAEAVSVLMECAPKRIDVDEVRQFMLNIPDVQGLHDLHIWTITSGMDALSAHVVIADAAGHTILSVLRERLHERFGIDHITIQVEPEEFDECACPY